MVRWSLLNHLVQSAQRVKKTPGREMPGYLLVDDPLFKALRKRNACLDECYRTLEYFVDDFDHGSKTIYGLSREIATNLFPVVSMKLMVASGYSLDQALLLLPELRVTNISLPANTKYDFRVYAIEMAKQLREENAIVPDLRTYVSFARKHLKPTGWTGFVGWLEDFSFAYRQGGQVFQGLSIEQAKQFFPLACVELMISEGIPFDEAMAMIPELRLV